MGCSLAEATWSIWGILKLDIGFHTRDDVPVPTESAFEVSKMLPLLRFSHGSTSRVMTNIYTYIHVLYYHMLYIYMYTRSVPLIDVCGSSCKPPGKAPSSNCRYPAEAKLPKKLLRGFQKAGSDKELGKGFPTSAVATIMGYCFLFPIYCLC